MINRFCVKQKDAKEDSTLEIKTSLTAHLVSTWYQDSCTSGIYASRALDKYQVESGLPGTMKQDNEVRI